MELLTPEQVNKVRTCRSARSHIYDQVAQIKPKHGMILKREEWKIKSRPADVICSFTRRKDRKSPFFEQFKGKKFSILSLEDNSGWLIHRIK